MAERQGRRARKAAPAARQVDYRRLRHPFAPQRLWSDDHIAQIHDDALSLLQELGIKILLPEARDIFARAGARVEDEMVFIGADIVAATLRSCPRSIRYRARNPDRDQVFEEGAMIFLAGAGCPHASDADRGRRPGTMQDFIETTRLQQAFDVIHYLGPSAEPQDVDVRIRHLDMMQAQIANADKPVFLYSRGQRQVEDGFAMIRDAFQLTDDDFLNNVWCSTIINTNSPRLIDRPMAQGVIDFARNGQIAVMTPFCLSGAMAPVTVAGALVLQHAEALAAIALAQLTKPGAPVTYGGFASNVDMKSGAPAFGTPAHIQLAVASGQLARHIDLPWRSASGSASTSADMQSAGETHMGLWATLMANATLIVHAAGWLEGGLTFGYEKFINDIEALQTIAELCIPPAIDAGARARAALEDVPPGGHFFGTAHTMDRYDTAFYDPLVADLSNFGNWEAAGSRNSTERATDIWKRTLAGFEPPPGSAEAADRVAAFVARRKAEGGAPPLD